MKPQKKAMKIINKTTDTKWLNNVMKSIGISANNVTKELSPNIYEFVTTGTQAAKDVVQTFRRGNVAERAASQLQQNRYVKAAGRAYKNILEDLASGKINNQDRIDEAFETAMFGDSQFDESENYGGDYSFGDMESEDSESSYDSSSSRIQFIDTGANETLRTGFASLAVHMSKNTEAQVRASKATMDTVVAIASANILETQKLGSEISNHLSNITNQLMTLNEYNNSNMTRLIDASIAYFERMGSKTDKDDQSMWHYDTDNDDSVVNDITRLFNSSSGGLNLDSYKDFLKKRIKKVYRESAMGMVTSMLDDDMALDLFVSNPLGMATDAFIKSIIPKVVTDTVEKVESTFSSFVPAMLSKIADMANDTSLGFSGTVKRTIGKVFGIKQSRTTSIDKNETITQGPVPFDGTTRHAITEIITKELREQTSYLKYIAEHYGIDTKEARQNSEVFDYNTGTYIKKKDVTANILNEIRDSRLYAMKDGSFGEAAQKVLENSKFSDAERAAMSQILDNFLLRVERGGRHVDVKDTSTGSAFSQIIQSLKEDNFDTSLVNHLSEFLKNMNETAALDLDRARLTASVRSNETIARIKEDPSRYNLYAADIDGNLDDLIMGHQRSLYYTNGDLQKPIKPGKYATQREWDAYKEQLKEYKKATKDRKKLIERNKKGENDGYRNRLERYREGQYEDVELDSIPLLNPFSAAGNVHFYQTLTNTGSEMARSIGSRLNGTMSAIVHGNSNAAFDNAIGLVTDQTTIIFNALKDNFLQPLGNFVLGAKNSDGYREGGILGKFENKITDMWKGLKHAVTGEKYTDSDGIEHDASSDNVITKLSNIGNFVKQSVMTRLFGSDEQVDADGNTIQKKVTGIFSSITDTIKTGFDDWAKAIFGTNTEEELEEAKTKFTDKFKESLPTALTGTVIGAGTGALGGSLMGWAIGGPIGGAIVGTTAGFISKSDKFQNWFFGEEDPDSGERNGGVNKKITDFFSSHFNTSKEFVAGTAAVGAVGGLITGGGVLGTLVGGPIAGTLVGVATGLLTKSNMFQEFLFGSDKSGQQGVVNIIKGFFKKTNEDQAEASGGSIALKSLGMVGTGIGAGAITAGLLHQVGVLGAALTPFGPIGGAVAGLGVAILAQKDNFHNWLFGTTDENGNKKEGFLGKFNNMMLANVLNPIKYKMQDFAEEAAIILKYDILGTIELAIEPLVNGFKRIFDPIAKRVSEGIAHIDTFIRDNFLDPLLDRTRDYILTPLRVGVSAASTALFTVAKNIIKTPFALLKKLTSPITDAIISVSTTVIGGLGKGIKKFVVDPLHNFFVKPLTKMVGGLFKLITMPFKVIGGIANYINDRQLNVGGDDKEIQDAGGRITNWYERRKKMAADKKVEMQNLRKRQKERKYRSKNEQLIEKLTGHQGWEDTEEHRLEAEAAAGHKINWKIDARKKENPNASTADGATIDDIVNNPNQEHLDVETRQLGVLQRILNVLMGKEPNARTNDRSNESDNQNSNEEQSNNELSSENTDEPQEGHYKTGARKIADDIEKAGGIGKYFMQQAGNFMHGTERTFNDFGNAASVGLSTAKASLVNKLTTASGAMKSGVRELLNKLNIKGFANGTDNAPEDEIVAVGDGGRPELIHTKGGEKIYSNEKPFTVVVTGFGSGVLNKIKDTFKNSIFNLFGKSKRSSDNAESDSSDLRNMAIETGNVNAVLDAHRFENNSEKNQEKLEDDMRAVITANKAKESTELAISKGETADERKARVKEEEEEAYKARIENTLQTQTENQADFKNSWLSVFGLKKGLITGLVLLAIPLLTRFIKKTIPNIANQLISSIGNAFGNISSQFTWTQQTGALGNGETSGDRISNNVDQIASTLDKATSGDVLGAIDEFVYGDDGEVDNQSGARAKGVAKVVSSGAAGIAGTVSKSANLINELKGAKTISEGIEAIAKNGNVITGATKAGSNTLIENGMSMVRSGGSTIGKTLGGVVNGIRNLFVKDPGTALATLTDNVSTIDIIDDAGNIITSISGGAVETSSKARSKVLSTVINYVKSFSDNVIAAITKKSGQKITSSTVKSLVDDACKIVQKHFSKIAAKVGAVLNVTAGLALTGIGYLAKTSTWVALGALNGLSGAARLFQVDADQVDALMVIISTAMGAFTGTTIGSIADIVNELIVSVTGVDFFTQFATLVYNFLAGNEKYANLIEAQTDFKNEYTEYQDAVLGEQYKTMVDAGIIDGTTVSLENFINGAKTGEYKTKYDSFADYNDKQHQTLGSHVLSAVGSGFKSIQNLVQGGTSALFGKTTEKITDANGNQYINNGDGTYQVIGADGKTDLGYISKDALSSVPGYNRTTNTTLGIVGTGIKMATDTWDKVSSGVSSFFVGKSASAYYDADSGVYYVSNGDGTFARKSVNGTTMGDPISSAELQAGIQLGKLVETTYTTEKSGLSQLVSNISKTVTTTWDSALKSGQEFATTQFNQSINRWKKIGEFASWVIQPAEYSDVWRTSSGDYYTSDGKHYTAGGEELDDTIDLETLSEMIKRHMLEPSTAITRKSGFSQMIDSVGATITNTWENVLTNAQTFVDKENKRQEQRMAALSAWGEKTRTNIRNFWKSHTDSVWYDDNLNYYAANGDSFDYYNGDGQLIATGISADEVEPLISSNILSKGKEVVQSDVGRMIFNFGTSLVSWKDNVVNSFTNFVDKQRAAQEEQARILKEYQDTQKDRLTTFFMGKTDTAYTDPTDLSYYVRVGDHYNHYSLTGDLIGENLPAEPIESQIASGYLEETEKTVDGTLKIKAKDALESLHNIWETIHKHRSEIDSAFISAGTGLMEAIKSDGLTGFRNYFSKKTTVVYYDPMGNYYKLNSNGSYDYYNMNNDLISSGIPASKIEDKRSAGMLTEGTIVQDSTAKTAINKIRGALQDAWNTAKNTAINGWKTFTSWLRGGSGGAGIGAINPSSYGSHISEQIKSVAGGKGTRVRGGRGNDDSSTVNGYTYYAQNDARWKDTPYTQINGDDKSATMENTGCGPTAFSMIASNMTGKNITPVETAAFAKSNGFRDETGTNWSFVENAANAYGIPTQTNYNPSTDYIQNELKNGHPMILSGVDDGSIPRSPYTSAGHYVVAVGSDSSGNVMVNDPRGKQYSTKIPVDDIASQTGAAWSFGGRGKETNKLGIINKLKKQIRGGRGVTLGDCREAVVGWMLSIIGRNSYTQSASRTQVMNGVNGHGYGDCSSTVWKVYETALGGNFQIGTWTGAQSTSNLGTQIGSTNTSMTRNLDESNLLPGDCIYFYGKGQGSTGSIGHVEMYIGNGYCAGHGSGTGPKISKLSDYINSFRNNLNGTWCKVIRFITQSNLSRVTLNMPNKNNYKVSNAYTDGNGNNSRSVANSVSNTTNSSVTSTNYSGSNDSSDIVSNITGFFSEMGNRALTGLLSGNYDTDYSSYFNGTDTSISSGNNTTTYSSSNAGNLMNGQDYIGRYVKQFESGSKGSRSRGNVGNDWGMSYGSYGLTLRWGNAIKFLKKYYPSLASKLYYNGPDVVSHSHPGAKYASPVSDVTAVWDKALAQDGETKFFKNEHSWIADHYYTPVTNYTKTHAKFDPDKHSRALQEAMWSWSVRSGAETAGKGFTSLFPNGDAQSKSVSELLVPIYNRQYAVNTIGKSRYSTQPGSERSVIMALGNQAPFGGGSGKGSNNKSKISNNFRYGGRGNKNIDEISKQLSESMDKALSFGQGGYGIESNILSSDSSSAVNSKPVHQSIAYNSNNTQTSVKYEQYLANIIDVLSRIAANTLSSSDKLSLLDKLSNSNNITVVNGGTTNNVVTSGNTQSKQATTSGQTRNARLAKMIASAS